MALRGIMRCSRIHSSFDEPWLCFLLLSCALGGCAGTGSSARSGAAEKLARIGLEILADEEAGIPAPERGRFIPCRVLPGRPDAALEDHPAGYLLVGVEGQGAGGRGAEAILRALAAWEPGEDLPLIIRRNPYLDTGSEWWERTVRLRLPNPKGPRKNKIRSSRSDLWQIGP